MVTYAAAILEQGSIPCDSTSWLVSLASQNGLSQQEVPVAPVLRVSQRIGFIPPATVQ